MGHGEEGWGERMRKKKKGEGRMMRGGERGRLLELGGRGGDVKVKTSARMGVSGTSVRSVVGEWLLAVAVEQGFACTCQTLLF